MAEKNETTKVRLTKEKKEKAIKSDKVNPLVLDSLTSALESSLPVVLTESTPAPKVTNKKSNKMKLPNLLRPLSPGFRSDSDESPTSPRRWHSPHFRRKKPKARHGLRIKSADSSPVKDAEDSSTTPPPDDLETTQVASLPGQVEVNSKDSKTSLELPTILVSPDEEDGCELMRKTSQSSHLSVSSSIVTSGIGSLLSPSGDEEGLMSDQDSLRSPLSANSSVGGSRDGINSFDYDTMSSSPAPTDGEADYIDVDLPSPSHDNNKGMLSLPPPRVASTTTKENYKRKKWNVLKKAIQWAPFVQVYKKKYPWVQLAGHQGNFTPGEENGTIIKKSTPEESQALQRLMDDVLRPHVPEFKREIVKDSEVYVEMVDLLREFDEPAVMDIKMGIRTYVEEELTKARVKETLRPDMYEKMVAVDPNEPTPEEHQQKAITKPRYMQWRETLSSTATCGFRIEGIKMPTEKPQKEEFKKVRARDDVRKHLKAYISKKPEVKDKFLQKLYDIRQALERSVFFQNHEVIGSSLLFVYDSTGQAQISIIDFGKTFPLPEGLVVDHRSEWKEGTHEDGYLFGLDNLIDIWKSL